MLKPLIGNTVSAVLISLAVVFAGVPAGVLAQNTAAAPAAAGAPDELIKSLSNDVLNSIRSDKSLQGGDFAKLQQLVDEKVLPYVNFERMTQLAVGRGWRQATPEQRQALSKEFRTLLVRTYAGAMSQVREHQVKMLPFRPTNPDDVVVRTQIVAPRGDPIQLDYRLDKATGPW